MTVPATILESFPAAQLHGDEISLLEERPGSALLLMTTATSPPFDIKVELEAPSASGALPRSFLFALGEFLNESLGVEATVVADGLCLRLSEEDWVKVSRLLAEKLQSLLAFLVRGEAPFVALGLLDQAAEEKGAGPAAEAPVALQESAQAQIAFAHEGSVLQLALALRRLPAWASSQDLEQALVRMLDRRLGLKASACAPPANWDSEFAHQCFLCVELGSSQAVQREVEGLFERCLVLLNGGLGAQEVFELSPSEQLPQGAHPSAPPIKEAPAALPAISGPTRDLHLLREGYNPPRVHQIVALTLSIDIINAQQLCEAAPVLLIPNLPTARADELAALLKRAGGIVEQTAPGQAPRGR